MGFNKLLKAASDGISEFAKKNGYIVLGIGAMVGLAASVTLAYKMRPKVDTVMKEKKQKVADIDNSTMPDEVKAEKRKEVTKETLKELAPVAAPLAACTLATIGCMGGTIAIAARRIDDLVSIARAGDIAYNNLYNATREVAGEEKTNEIQVKMAENDMKVAGINRADGAEISYDGFIITHHGDTPFYDAVSGRLLLCDLAFIEKAVDQLNIELLSKPPGNRKLSYNDYGTRIGLPYSILAEGKCWTDQIILNTANAFPWGSGSVRVIDFVQRPMLIL